MESLLSWFHIDWRYGLFGGVLIGVSASLLLLVNGRVAGISGIWGGLFGQSSSMQTIQGVVANEKLWRILFVVGLISGALLYIELFDEVAFQLEASNIQLVVAGLLVGIGTRIGNGCTSGHGVCGIGRKSLRSLIATLVFMATAIITVFVTKHLIAG